MSARRKDGSPPKSVRDALAAWWSRCAEACNPPCPLAASNTDEPGTIEPLAIPDYVCRQLAALPWAAGAAQQKCWSTMPGECTGLQGAERRVSAARCTLRGGIFGTVPGWQTHAVATVLPCSLSPKVAIVSSRLSSPLEKLHLWFAALRTTMSMPIPGIMYLVGARSTVAPWAERWAQWSGRKLWLVRYLNAPLSRSDTLGDCLWKALAECAQSADPIGKIFLFGPAALGQARPSEEPAWERYLRRAVDDAAACALADLIVVLRVKPRGRIAHLLERAGQCKCAPRVWLASAPPPGHKPCATIRAASNVLLWRRSDSAIGSRSFHLRGRALARIQVAESPSALLDEPYLVHWTRSPDGPWPGQSLAAYRDDFLMDRTSKFRSPLDALLRILRSRCIEASQQAIRGGYRVVCFAEVPLEELKNRRIFRSHRRRWDFNPYGIAILRRHLEDAGARPVIYGDEDCWRNLRPALRPFFQKAHSRSGQYDWTSEREWRIVGDCHLESLPREAVRVFVANAKEARIASYFSRWPVIALDPPNSEDDVTFTC